MLRARRWVLALIVALGVCWLSGPGWRPAVPGLVGTPEPVVIQPLGVLAQAVSWPVSSGLLVSEVVTGGTGASDEFVEIYNASADSLDLGGLELVYVTSSGSTVTRKQTWTALLVPSHRHLLLANSAGVYAAAADGLYTGGFAATGGSLVLRTLGGAVVDSISWGDAASQFVEGAAGAAPAAGLSLERRPGGANGNATDTNDNLSDTRVESSPVAHNLAAAAVPAATPTAIATPTPSATAAPTSTTAPTGAPTSSPAPTPTIEPISTPTTTPTQSPSPTPAPTATPSLSPTPTATATFEATPTASATATESPSLTPTDSPSPSAGETPVATPSDTPSSTPTATPIPTPEPTATPMSIAFARNQAAGASVFVRGVVSAEIGDVLGETVLAMQDETAGILVKLPADANPALVLGDQVGVTGVLAAPYGNLEIRPAATGVTVIGPVAAPEPRDLVAADLGEGTEGLLARLTGRLTHMDSSSSGSLTLFLTDSSGEDRVFLDARFGLHTSDFAVGQTLAVSGIVGDRLGLYRLWPRSYSDITLVASAPSPTPSPTHSPSPTPKPSPTPSPTWTSTPAPHATPTPAPPIAVGIAEALRSQGGQVSVEGVVTTKPGLLDTDGQRVTIQDATAAVVVRLPANAAAHLGERLRVSGAMTTYYGAPSLNADEARGVGEGSVNPRSVDRAPIAADLEWQLVSISGRVEFVHKDGDAWRAELTISGNGIPISGVARSGIPSTALVAGRTATIKGIVRRAYPTASDQRFMVVPRSAADINLGSAVRPQPSGSTGSNGNGHGSNGSNATPRPSAPRESVPVGSAGPEEASGQTLADLAAHESEVVSVGGLITAVAGVRITIEDESATAIVRLVGDAAPLAGMFGPGDLVNATGTVERTPEAGIEIVVDDPSGLRRLTQPAAVVTAGPSQNAAQTPTYAQDTPAETASEVPIAALALLGIASALALIGLVAANPKLREPIRARLRTLRRC